MRLLISILLILIVSFAAAAPKDAEEVMSCIILPDEQVDLGSPVPGVIEHIDVRRSDRVRAGQPIARLESSVEQATVALARARASTQTELDLRRVEYGYDAQHRDRLNALQAKQAVSSQNLEDAERVAEAAQLRVRLAQDRRREAMLDKRRADAMLALKTIKSPIDGVVLQLHNRVGEYVETRPVVRIARLDPLRVEVIAPLTLFGSVQQGMQVAISPETDPGSERVATVTAVDAVADPGSGTFGIELSLPNPDHGLPAGIKCTGRLLPPQQATNRKERPTPVRHDTSETALHQQSEDTDSLANARAPEVCLVFSPQADEQQARELVTTARRLGAQADVHEVNVSRVFGYVVVTPVAPNAESLNEMAKRIRDAGITDLAIIEQGEFAGRIALGTYNGPVSAERRRTSLEGVGFATEVLPRTRNAPGWQVDVRTTDKNASEELVAQIQRLSDVTIDRSASCDSMLTASR